MKKIFFFFLISLYLYSEGIPYKGPILISPIFAQEFDFPRAYQDYLYTYNQYRPAHQNYIAARSAYLTYKTLTAKTEAMSKTLKMLQLRDEAIRTYLTALRLKLAETTGISNYEQTVLYLKLDSEVNWYFKHRDALPSAGTLEDLVKSSAEAEDQFKKTEVLAYQALGTILSGKEEALRDRIREEIRKINDKLAEIRQRGDKDTAVLERWTLEAENKLTRSQEKQYEAQQKLAKLKPTDRDKQKKYNEARSLFRESHQYLKEANSYLKELVREVKRAD